ncbi:MAG: DivIVA domain-containing protein [Firmicutes bacterium]|nr:DivIVA domain-containing protein [Bacillota bacterium]
MITPLEIQNKEFKKGLRGYKEVEVDSFLDEVITDYEKIYKENIELKDKLSMLNDQIKHYDDIEDTLQNTLVVAQKTAEEVNLNARNKSQQIIDEAEEKARQIIEKAHQEVVEIQKEYEDVKKETLVFKMRFKTLLKSQLESMEEYFEEQDIKNDE